MLLVDEYCGNRAASSVYFWWWDMGAEKAILRRGDRQKRWGRALSRREQFVGQQERLQGVLWVAVVYM